MANTLNLSRSSGTFAFYSTSPSFVLAVEAITGLDAGRNYVQLSDETEYNDKQVSVHWFICVRQENPSEAGLRHYYFSPFSHLPSRKGLHSLLYGK